MRFVVIQSGSKGNATLVIDKGRVLLIDMGIGIKTLKGALEEENLNIYNINAMLLTHEHWDHTSGIKYLPPLPIYCTKETLLDNKNVVELKPYETFQIEHLKITPVSTNHDVRNPLGFVIENDEEKLVYLTDSGKITVKSLQKLKNADYYIIESNHDPDMLMATNRPMMLKRRILSTKGHLSNEQSASYMCKCIGDKTKEIVLAHLSEEANTPELAMAAYLKIFKHFGINPDNYLIRCANQHVSLLGGRKDED